MQESISTAHTGFQMEAKNGNDCVEISAYVKDLQVVKIDLEPSSKASLITHGCSFVTPRPEISKQGWQAERDNTTYRSDV